jgi:hypothetical protein
MTCLLLTNSLAATILNVVLGPNVAFRSVVSIAIDRQGARPRYFNNIAQSVLHCTKVLQQIANQGLGRGRRLHSDKAVNCYSD